MKRFIATIGIWYAFLLCLSATTVQLAGRVTFGENDRPATNYPLVIMTYPGDESVVQTDSVFTDEDGFYQFQYNINRNTIRNVTVVVEVLDFCLGINQAQRWQVDTDHEIVEFNADFILCSDIAPPPPTVNCSALFFYEQLPPFNDYMVQFVDLSYSDQPIARWLWDFGDGRFSDLPTPNIQFDSAGVYPVSLTIVSDGCESTFKTVVVITDTEPCNCPLVYEPICTPAGSETGERLTFINSCWAECAGFAMDQLEPCMDCNCPRILQPVCAVNPLNQRKQTFDNRCLAECMGYLVVDESGACSSDCYCPQVFDPVCAFQDDGQIIRFENPCVANCKGFYDLFPCDSTGNELVCKANFFAEILDQEERLVLFNDITIVTNSEIIDWHWDFGDGSEAREPAPTHQYQQPGTYKVTFTIITSNGCTSSSTQRIAINGRNPCDCGEIYAPVCVKIHGTDRIISFPNQCLAFCAGYSHSDLVDCDAQPCECPEYYDPVCVRIDDGTLREFPNECFAACEGFGPDQFESCEDMGCACPEYYEPVCVRDANGTIQSFDNKCFAICAGYCKEDFIDCKSDCQCPDVFEPVCATDPTTGQLETFGNLCEAECKGFVINYDGPCVLCDCAAIYEPVCATNAFTGDRRTFGNACEAECSGYKVLFEGTCESDSTCICPGIYEPVCAVPLFNASVPETFSNACKAECAGFLVLTNEACNVDSLCICPEIFDPVYVAVGQDTIQFVNSCFANCLGFDDSEIYKPESDSIDINLCDCPEIYNPVCVELRGGPTLFFDNPCEALCAGFADNFHQSCIPDSTACPCTKEYNPVCVATPSGDIISFNNPCLAECEGFGADIYFKCQPPDSTCICTKEYDPVCVILPNDVIETFGNACLAKCAGHQESNFVECQTDPNCICTDEWNPVDVLLKNGNLLTFGNLCEAQCAGFNEYDLLANDDSCMCDNFYKPVCVKYNGGELRFINACHAICEGFQEEELVECPILTCFCVTSFSPACIDLSDGRKIEFEGSCDAECEGYLNVYRCDAEPEPCYCPEYFDPVCVLTVNGEFKQFSNRCFAACEGYCESDFVDCPSDCICYEIYDPVCVVTRDGDIIEFPNDCFAKCEGYTEADFTDCSPCSCTLEYDPVCVIGPDGTIISFPNRCTAECEGYLENDLVPCDEACVCPDVFAPVCVLQDNGITISFTNACYAACQGYTEADFISCDSTLNCGCPLIFDPVCTIDEQGKVLSFANECVAICQGVRQFYACREGNQGCFANFDWLVDLTTIGFPTIAVDDISYAAEGDSITEWIWDFGDGTIITEQNPIHSYEQPGKYWVQLTIVTANGCVSETKRLIFVGNKDSMEAPPCQAIFYSVQDSTNGNTFLFQDVSIGEITSWHWNFGDGFTSNEQSPLHAYDVPGTYLVTLTINAGLCENTMQVLLTVNSSIWYERACNALFLPILQDSSEVFFMNLSSEDAVEFFWDFGDGNTSSEHTIQHTYATPGNYEVTLKIETSTGCTNTYVVQLNMLENDFTGAPTFFITTSTEEKPEIVKDLNFYPNPVQEFVTFEYFAVESSELTLQIISLNGQSLKSQALKVKAGLNQHQINLSGLPSGIYLAKVQSDNFAQSFRLVKTE